MRRVMVAVGLVLMLGTCLQPAVLAASPADGAPAPWTASRAGYHTFASMVSELQALQAAHPDLVMLESIGRTYEGRDIWAAKLSDDVATNDTTEPDVLIFGGIHAREVMGVEVPMFVLNYMVDNYGKNETLTKYINTKETWFVPMLNVDGHVYIEQGNDWRKNRRPTSGGSIGVDLNRNFGYMFGVDGSTSDNPASEVYHGPYPFSENETIAIRDLALRQRFVTSLSFHSVASLILYPWGFTDQPAPDHDELDAMARTMAAWNGYTPEQSSDLYYTHGDSEDWFYANVSTLAFTIELDTAFHPPESQIPISCALNREAVLYLIGYASTSIVDAGVFALLSPTNLTPVDPDRPLNVSARIMNYGSANEDIPVEMRIANGTTEYLNSTEIFLRAGQVGSVNFTWEPPLSEIQNYTVEVRTNLTGDSISWNDERGTTFRVKAKYGAALNATGNTTLPCYPGESVEYPMELRSLSNRPDELLLVASGNPLEWANLSAASFHLPVGGTASVTLTMAIPRGAPPGTLASVSVRAFSSTGQGTAGVVSTSTKVLDPAPVAVTGPDRAVNVTEEVEFDGSASTTPLGILSRYSWDFGDGNRSEGAIVAHAYMRRGTYIATLSVESDKGWQSNATVKVTVTQDFKMELFADTSSPKVRPGENATVNLTLRNAGNGPDDFALTLESVKWSASLEVARVQLSAGETRRLALNISVPAGSLAGATAMFRVKAASKESPYTTADVVLMAEVRVVRDLAIDVAERSRTAAAGSSPYFLISLNNRGNVMENVTFTADVVPEGWTAHFARDNISLPAYNSSVVRVTLPVPPDALAGDYAVVVNGIELTVAVAPRYGLNIQMDNRTAELLPGRTAVFSVTLFNSGNLLTNFTLRLPDLPPGWTAAGIGAPVPVSPGGSTALTLSIQVPSGAKAGTYDMTLAADGDAASNMTKSMAIQIRVLEAPVSAPGPLSGSGMLLPALILIIVIAAVVVAGAVVYARRRGRSGETAPAPRPPATVPDDWVPEDAGRGRPPAQGTPAAAGGEYPDYSRQELYPAMLYVPGEQEQVREAEPVAMAEGGEILPAEMVPVAEATPAMAPAQETCLWCFKRVKRGEPVRRCAGCGALLHTDCAWAARSCPRCGRML